MHGDTCYTDCLGLRNPGLGSFMGSTGPWRKTFSWHIWAITLIFRATVRKIFAGPNTFRINYAFNFLAIAHKSPGGVLSQYRM